MARTRAQRRSKEEEEEEDEEGAVLNPTPLPAVVVVVQVVQQAVVGPNAPQPPCCCCSSTVWGEGQPPATSTYVIAAASPQPRRAKDAGGRYSGPMLCSALPQVAAGAGPATATCDRRPMCAVLVVTKALSGAGHAIRHTGRQSSSSRGVRPRRCRQALTPSPDLAARSSSGPDCGGGACAADPGAADHVLA